LVKIILKGGRGMQEYTGEIKTTKDIEELQPEEKKLFFSLDGFTEDQILKMKKAINRKERLMLRSIFRRENKITKRRKKMEYKFKIDQFTKRYKCKIEMVFSGKALKEILDEDNISSVEEFRKSLEDARKDAEGVLSASVLLYPVEGEE
jgi:DNA replication initiation complex subunit (GINS family)